MKKIETIKTGKNYAAVSVGKMNEIIEHELPMGPGVTIKGKVFVGQAVDDTGSELSFQTLVPGQDSGFLHTHKTHEELYIILRGEGQYQVDGEIFPVSEGTIVRVSPDGTSGQSAVNVLPDLVKSAVMRASWLTVVFVTVMTSPLFGAVMSEASASDRRARTAGVPSSEPSSTTSTSISVTDCASAERTLCAAVASQRYAGMITLMRGVTSVPPP